MAQLLDPDVAPAFADLPTTDEVNGPAIVDRETLLKVAEQIQAGRLQFPPHMDATILAVPQERFDAAFRAGLDAARLTSKLATVTDRRALGLAIALGELTRVETDGAPTEAIDPVGLEMFLASTADALPARFTAEQRELLRDELFMLTAGETATALGVSVAQLQQWRFHRRGPRYVKVSQQRESIRYPVGSLLLWAEQNAVNS